MATGRTSLRVCSSGQDIPGVIDPIMAESDDENGAGGDRQYEQDIFGGDSVGKNSTKKNVSSGAQSAKTAARDSAPFERIAEKAYELFQKRGSVHGHDLEDWLEAERLVVVDPEAQVR